MVRLLVISGLAMVAALAQIDTAEAQSNSPPFPRLGAYLIGGPLDPGTVAHIGAMQAIIITGYEGFPGLQAHVANAKAANPNMKVTAYVKINSQVPTNNPGYQGELNQMAAANWWVRAGYPSGGIATEFGGGENAVNIVQSHTSTNAPYPGGPTSPMTVRQWMAQYANHYFGPGIASNLDGVFTDNFYFQPRAVSGGLNQADWLDNGTEQPDSNATTQQNWRDAYVDWDTQMRAAMGSQYMHWGNVADWNPGNDITGYKGLLNGGVMEHTLPAYESGQGWTGMMNFYKVVMTNLAPFNGEGPYAIFQNDGSPTDYQGMRYGLGSCLLDNGYYYAAPNGQYNAIAWFDEFSQNLGQPIAGPNNPTNGTYSNGGLTVWKQGVWRRDFQNGIALVNPKGNGVQTVTLETTYQHFSGTQDPSVNNGQSVTSVTLNDRDGVILLRTTPVAQQAVPDAPTLSVQ